MDALFIDAGHGGVRGGRYLTPGKRFFHEGKNLHDGGWFYEGVSNRLYADGLIERMKKYPIKVYKVYHSYVDTPLAARVFQVNKLAKEHGKSLLFSLHSNALNGKSSGFSVWTTVGNTKSDEVATDIVNQYKLEMPKARVITDMRDKDPDFESDFYIIKHSNCPAVLMEYLFFDNPADVETIVNDPISREKYLTALEKAACNYFGLEFIPGIVA